MTLPFIVTFFAIAVILLMIGVIIKRRSLQIFGLVIFSISIWQLGSYVIQSFA